MIENFNDYKFYLESDRVALSINKWWPQYFTHKIWKFERLLRKLEYYNNCKKTIIYFPYYCFLLFLYRRYSLKLGFTIPPNCFGPGLSIGHPGTLIVNYNARIGENCRIHNCVYIATKAGFSDQAPKIGNNVYIGPGAKIFGPIEIADGVAIGANSVVNKSIKEPWITVAGVPAKKISEKGSRGLIIQATDIVRKNTGRL